MAGPRFLSFFWTLNTFWSAGKQPVALPSDLLDPAMLTLAIPAWSLILRVVTIYLAILVGLRLAGKRELGQMTVFDFVVLLLIANAL